MKVQLLSNTGTGFPAAQILSASKKQFKNLRVEKSLNLLHYICMKPTGIFHFLTIVAVCSIFRVPVFSQSARPVVTGINAEGTADNLITVSWILPKERQGIYVSGFKIYRNTRPIKDFRSLTELKPLAILPAGTISYTDTVNPSVEYYYAVLSLTKSGTKETEPLFYDEELDSGTEQNAGTLLEVLIPGVNSTVIGARSVYYEKKQLSSEKTAAKQPTIEPKTYENGEIRELPLPYVDILGDGTKHEKTISKKTQETASSFIRQKKESVRTKKLSPYIFDEDLISPPGGDDYLLFDILKTTFIKKKYSDAAVSLQKFLAQNRTKETSARAAFYLGESHYFMENYDTAVSVFLGLAETYPQLTNRWIESSLDLYRAPIEQ